MSRKSYKTLLPFIFAASDLLLINMCLFICFYIANKYYGTNYEIRIHDLLVSTAIWILSTRFFSLYNIYTLFNYKCVCRSTWRSILVYIVFFQLYTLFNFNLAYTNMFLASFYATVMI